MTHRQCNHHITQLTTSTICNYTFNVILHNTHSSSHQSSYCPDNCLCSTAGYTLFPKGISTRNLKNTCSYLSCSVDLCGYGGWTFHSIRKPYVQPNLSALTQSTSCKEKTNKIRILCRTSQCCNQSSICRSLIPPRKEQSKEQNSITNTIYLHCFLCCLCSTQTMKPETNLLITTYTNHFPAYL
jgi:hypothetical protein